MGKSAVQLKIEHANQSRRHRDALMADGHDLEVSLKRLVNTKFPALIYKN